uniref:XK-related protein n=1 Tax=Daphnia galeata TaxID=27404 RepID=A0A8J2RQG6_9CRUS|nr:unnamed protein product [Daphnia galeata]
MLKGEFHFGDLSTIFPIFSVISLSWALVTYDQKISLIKAIKRDDEHRQTHQSSGITMDEMINIVIQYIGNINFKNIALLFSAHFFWIVSRLIALSLFAFGCGWIIWVACVSHVMATFVWHWNENNYNFMDSLRLSFLHVFAYLYPLENESDRREYPRLSPVFYLFVCSLENVVLMGLWSQSLIEGNDRLNFIKSCRLPPWNEWNFFIPWIVQFVTICLSFLLFILFNKERQSQKE